MKMILMIPLMVFLIAFGAGIYPKDFTLGGWVKSILAVIGFMVVIYFTLWALI